MVTWQQCQSLDKADQLAPHRHKFALPEGIIYLNGNSLGPLPISTQKRLQDAVTIEWGQGLIRSWNSAQWFSLPQRLGAMVATLIGAKPEEVIVVDSTSVNLFKLVHAALRIKPDRPKIITEKGNFPTDAYILQGIARDNDIVFDAFERDKIIENLDESTAVLVLTHVHYKTGQMWPMQEITQYAQKLGILVIWDLSHSAGAVPIDLNQSNADFAVGCGYKYLNGGPGAPSFMYVAERHLAAFQQPLTGWFGHANPFAMSDQYQAAQGIKSAQCGTPSVLASIALEEGLTLFKDISLDVLRDKSIRLCELFLTLSEEKLGKFEMELISPREAELRGSHISLAHPHGYAIMQALIARGVIGDFRAPDILRFGFAPLYVSFCDVYKAVAIIEEVMLSEHWRKPEYQIRAKVT